MIALDCKMSPLSPSVKIRLPHIILIVCFCFRTKNYSAGSGLFSPYTDWSQHLA